MNLSAYFTGVGAKRLSPVEVSPDDSNQHEFNGVAFLKEIFGIERIVLRGDFIYLADDENESITASGFLTWYDARENHPTRSEYRLYYTPNSVLHRAKAGDLLVIARSPEGSAMVILAPRGSTVEKQLLWLFNIDEAEHKFIVRNYSNSKQDIGFAGRYILRSLGIEVKEKESDYFDELVAKFGSNFPTTKEFSEFSRGTVKDVSPVDDPDETLLAWLEREELLFKHLEKDLIRKKLSIGFGDEGNDVEEFVKFSLSIQNRRKSRAGFAFENNLAIIFVKNGIRFSHGAVTERNNRPDFIFPDIEYYHNPRFDSSGLTMLGLKTTAKDRWRQVLSEAARISEKHLITLEPAISRNQTEEMIANKLQLVIPTPLLKTFKPDQQSKIITLKSFIDLVKERQLMFPELRLF